MQPFVSLPPFMHPLDPARALEFWRRVADDVGHGDRALLLAEDPEGVTGTVQLVLAQPELVLDTETGGDAERLYARLGRERCAVIADLALRPRGGLAATTGFRRAVPAPGAGA